MTCDRSQWNDITNVQDPLYIQGIVWSQARTLVTVFNIIFSPAYFHIVDPVFKFNARSILSFQDILRFVKPLLVFS